MGSSLCTFLNTMLNNGTWKSEPASEDGWDVDWSIAGPDPEFIEREAWEAYREMYQTDYQSKRD